MYTTFKDDDFPHKIHLICKSWCVSLFPFLCSHTMLNFRSDSETTSTLYLNICTCGFRETCLTKDSMLLFFFIIFGWVKLSSCLKALSYYLNVTRYRDIHFGIFLPLGKQWIPIVPNNNNKHTCKDRITTCNLICSYSTNKNN